ncbi:hypothetical protein EVJ58_g1685 [Rhodofomes roseus]|uniref:NADP-dependent oxidoreductase domain-containing protein n=1 Tax=Rhodofomes roseus TaxID=34475 RepID=A0A4Y9YYA7_9APHY|nr:hypothetical protein EVJ58_g1685 [Rhodofomes roseus]
MSLKKRPMQYVRLGKSGLKVSKIILGCMSYGSHGWNEWVIDDQEEVTEHIKVAYELGIQTFDTANVYSNGLSEVMLGKAIKDLKLPREELVIMTKLCGSVAPKYDMSLMRMGVKPDEVGLVNQHGLNRKHIFDSVKKSLERLGVDYIDLLQCHRFDYETPIEETMSALHDVVKAGLVYREEEREMFPTLKMFGVGSIPWSPVARGVLTRPLADQTKRSQTDQFVKTYVDYPGTPEIVKRVEDLAKKKGVSMAQISIAWSLSKEVVSAPIVGTTSLQHLGDMVGAVNVELTAEEVKYLEDPYVPVPISGHQ